MLTKVKKDKIEVRTRADTVKSAAASARAYDRKVSMAIRQHRTGTWVKSLCVTEDGIFPTPFHGGSE
jgi:hypothetical protein